MKPEPLRFTRGDLVRTWFDTGALGAAILYGRVVQAGSLRCTVEWESGLRNRIDNRIGFRPAGIERITPSHAEWDTARKAVR